MTTVNKQARLLSKAKASSWRHKHLFIAVTTPNLSRAKSSEVRLHAFMYFFHLLPQTRFRFSETSVKSRENSNCHNAELNIIICYITCATTNKTELTHHLLSYM